VQYTANLSGRISWKAFAPAMKKLPVLTYLPGIQDLLSYRRENLAFDLRAGLTLAAVALPISFANAQIAGFSPVVGLYSFLLPMTVYVLLGTSRHLVIGPDAATAALVAAAITPLAQDSLELYTTLSIVLAMMVGFICLLAGALRLGGIADFLSRPILIGFLHGIALQIIVDQIPVLLGFHVEAQDVIPALLEIVSHIRGLNIFTVVVSAAAAVVLSVLARRLPKLPAALLTMIFAAIAVAILGLKAHDVATIGSMTAGLPRLRFDLFRPDLIKQLIGVAGGVAVVSYAGVIVDARIFATKNAYDIDADREFIALGAAQLASAISQGFCVGSLDSGAPVVDSTGGRTRMTALIAVIAIVVVVSFFMPALAYVPTAALAVIVLGAAWGMTDIPYLRALFRMSLAEFAVAITAFFGVISLGAVDAILLAVVLALLRFLRLTSRPAVELLGRIPDVPGFHALGRNRNAAPIDGMLIFRFNAPIIFFNAPYFRKTALEAVEKTGARVRWFVLDAIPVSHIDVTGWHTLTELADQLEKCGIRLVIAGRRTQIRTYARNAGVSLEAIEPRLFPTIGMARRKFLANNSPTS
jgi:high affinity sulfate transporter 1